MMFSVKPEIYNTLFLASRWLFVFFALVLLFFAFSWLHSERKSFRERFKNLPGAGTVGEMTVISGGDELARDSWFPVPREGVLGALRSCDLVVPCNGVRSHHLDFSWQDGTGLLIRPRPGCEVLIDGVPVDRRGAADAAPMIHGSFLQIGDAVLRLQLFAALDHTNRVFSSPASVADVPQGSPDAAAGFVLQQPAPPSAPWSQQAFPVPPVDGVPAVLPEEYPADPSPVPEALPVNEQNPLSASPSSRRRRADRWKEDWSE